MNEMEKGSKQEESKVLNKHSSTSHECFLWTKLNWSYLLTKRDPTVLRVYKLLMQWIVLTGAELANGRCYLGEVSLRVCPPCRALEGRPSDRLKLESTQVDCRPMNPLLLAVKETVRLSRPWQGPEHWVVCRDAIPVPSHLDVWPMFVLTETVDSAERPVRLEVGAMAGRIDER